MERLTRWNEQTEQAELTAFDDLEWENFKCGLEVSVDIDVSTAINKLAGYEDSEEQGLLLKVPCEKVWFIVDKGTKFATVMGQSTKFLYLYELKGIDKDGKYWSTKEKAEEVLAKLQKGD